MLLRTDYDHAVTRRHLFSDCHAFAKKIVLTKRIVWFDGPNSAIVQSRMVSMGLEIQRATNTGLCALSVKIVSYSAGHYRPHWPRPCKMIPLRGLTRGRAVIAYLATFFAVCTVLAILIH
jgi:hypothetical protein